MVSNWLRLFLLRSLTEPACEWVKNNLDLAGSFQPWWPTVVIEHHYVADILEGIRNESLVIA